VTAAVTVLCCPPVLLLLALLLPRPPLAGDAPTAKAVQRADFEKRSRERD
jgi:hypothetical protein